MECTVGRRKRFCGENRGVDFLLAWIYRLVSRARNTSLGNHERRFCESIRYFGQLHAADFLTWCIDKRGPRRALLSRECAARAVSCTIIFRDLVSLCCFVAQGEISLYRRRIERNEKEGERERERVRLFFKYFPINYFYTSYTDLKCTIKIVNNNVIQTGQLYIKNGNYNFFYSWRLIF